MESTASIPDFACSLHPNEIIKRVSTKTGMVYCLECILSVAKENKTNLVSIDKFLEILEEKYSRIVKIGDTPSDSVKCFIDDFKVSVEEKIKLKIEEEKQKAVKIIEKVQENLNELLEKKKQEISNKLDSQAEAVNSIFESYIKCAEYYFRPSDRKLFEKQVYLNKISRLQTSSHVASLFQKSVEELKNLILSDENEKDLNLEAITNMKFISNHLQNIQNQAPPTLEYNSIGVRSEIDSLMKDLSVIKNEYPKLTVMNLSFPDISWIKNKLSPNVEVLISEFPFFGTIDHKIDYFTTAIAGTVGMLIKTEDERLFVLYKRKNLGETVNRIRLEVTTRTDQTNLFQSRDMFEMPFMIGYGGTRALILEDSTKIGIKDIEIFSLKVVPKVSTTNSTKTSLFNNSKNQGDGSFFSTNSSFQPLVKTGFIGGNIFSKTGNYETTVSKNLFNNNNK